MFPHALEKLRNNPKENEVNQFAHNKEFEISMIKRPKQSGRMFVDGDQSGARTRFDIDVAFRHLPPVGATTPGDIICAQRNAFGCEWDKDSMEPASFLVQDNGWGTVRGRSLISLFERLNREPPIIRSELRKESR